MKRINRKSVFIVLLAVLFLTGIPKRGSCAEEVKEILSIEAYDMLNTVPDTYLIDVRTRPEYQYVGHPNNAYLFPYMFWTDTFVEGDEGNEYQLSQKNKDFVSEVSKLFEKTDNLLIISRDGERSALAAKDLVDSGFKKIFDIKDGFEGPEFPAFEEENKDKFYRQLAKRNKIYGYRHRRYYGWQCWGLPWTYELDTKYTYPPDLTEPE